MSSSLPSAYVELDFACAGRLNGLSVGVPAGAERREGYPNRGFPERKDPLNPTALAPRTDFPILAPRPGAPGALIYLDSAATTQRPQAVIEAIARFLGNDNAKVERSVYALGERATQAHALARVKVARLLGARDAREVVFLRGATEALNLLAQTHGKAVVHPGDEVVVTAFEHHSNLVPWQVLCRERSAHLRVAPIAAGGSLDLSACKALLGPRTRIVATAHASSATGTLLPVRELAELAHACGAVLVVDGAFAAPRLRLDVRELGCDFYTVSAHKMYGPTGVGALWGRAELLELLEPWQTGGDMVRTVTFEHAEYAPLPQRLEAGTPNIEGAIGWGAAIDYLTALGLERVAAHEQSLLDHARRGLAAIPGARVLCARAPAVGALAFTLDGVHPHDLATVLDQDGIAVRAGHLCSQPLLAVLGAGTAVRLSVGVYNSLEDIEACLAGIRKAVEIFR